MGVTIASLVETARALKHRAHAHRLARRGEGGRAMDAWRAVCADTVRGGPFAGMRYPPRWGDGCAPAKWLGSYEDEVLPALVALTKRAPRQVVVVGSADGYFTVGLARALSDAQVDAFDTDVVARWNTRRLARLNETKVRMHGAATPESIAAVLTAAHTLVICDCEGYEDVLLDPTRVPALAHCDLMVELHETGQPAMGERIAARFSGAKVAFIHTRDRDVEDYPALTAIAEPLRPYVVREFRYAQRWMMITRAGWPRDH